MQISPCLALVVVSAASLFANPGHAQPRCETTQLTNIPASNLEALDPAISGDGEKIAFIASANLTGGNPDLSDEVFVFHNGSLTQLTQTLPMTFTNSPVLDADGSHIAFNSNADLTGDNPDGSFEVFLFDGSSLQQVTQGSTQVISVGPALSGDGSILTFSSNGDFTGGNSDGSSEIFLYDGQGFSQLTDAAESSGGLTAISRDGLTAAFSSSADHAGTNADSSREVYIWNGGLIEQVTDLPSGQYADDASVANDGSIAFASRANITGMNADGSSEVFFYDGDSFTQVSDDLSTTPAMSADGNAVAFVSRPNGPLEPANVVLYNDGTSINVTTGQVSRLSIQSISDDGTALTFASGPALGSQEIFKATCLLTSIFADGFESGDLAEWQAVP